MVDPKELPKRDLGSILNEMEELLAELRSMLDKGVEPNDGD